MSFSFFGRSSLSFLSPYLSPAHSIDEKRREQGSKQDGETVPFHTSGMKGSSADQVRLQTTKQRPTLSQKEWEKKLNEVPVSKE